MVSRPNHLLQRLTTMSLINKICTALLLSISIQPNLDENWLANPKWLPRFIILTFNYFSKYETIETHAHTFLTLIILAIGRVACLPACDVRYITFFSSVFVMQHVRPRRGTNIFVMTNEGETE